jgi:hypothetical protein
MALRQLSSAMVFLLTLVTLAKNSCLERLIQTKKVTLCITGSKKQSDEAAALFAARVHALGILPFITYTDSNFFSTCKTEFC